MYHNHDPPTVSSLPLLSFSTPPLPFPLHFPAKSCALIHTLSVFPLELAFGTRHLSLLIRYPEPELTIISLLLLFQSSVFNSLCHSLNHIWNHRTEDGPRSCQEFSICVEKSKWLRSRESQQSSASWASGCLFEVEEYVEYPKPHMPWKTTCGWSPFKDPP